jgi:hypothetical protein
MLKKLGADRVINYREEDVKEVLKNEYKKVFHLLASLPDLFTTYVLQVKEFPLQFAGKLGCLD